MTDAAQGRPAAPTAGQASPGVGITLDHVSHRYITDSGEVVHAVADTSVEIPAGQFTCVVGPSGCGKTTLLKAIAGFLRPTGGQVLAGGEPVTGPGAERGVVFQHANLYPWLTVRKNVEVGLRFRGVPAAQRRAAAEEALHLVGLARFMDSKPYELSGGMQQRAQIARVLASDPGIILMDEPFGALDAITRRRLQNELLSIARQKKKTIFFITHSVDEAVFLGDRVLVMSPRPGRVVMDQDVQISSHYDHPLLDELRSAPEFTRLRDTISEAIREDEP